MSKKFFQGVILESVFLNMINDASDRGLHGYAIFRAVQKKFGVNLAASTIYPELKHLRRRTHHCKLGVDFGKSSKAISNYYERKIPAKRIFHGTKSHHPNFSYLHLRGCLEKAL